MSSGATGILTFHVQFFIFVIIKKFIRVSVTFIDTPKFA